MNSYTVTWTIDVETEGSHQGAAQTVAELCFDAHIAAGDEDSACVFTVTGADGAPVIIDLSDRFRLR